MAASETQVPPSGIQWSDEKPEFESAGLISPLPHGYPERAMDYFGSELVFSFSAGSLDDVASFHSALVEFQVREYLTKEIDELIGENIGTFYKARQIFPLHRQAAISGILITPAIPSVDELEVFAGGLMNTLALRQAPSELEQ
jgi:hypothetical protein